MVQRAQPLGPLQSYLRLAIIRGKGQQLLERCDGPIIVLDGQQRLPPIVQRAQFLIHLLRALQGRQVDSQEHGDSGNSQEQHGHQSNEPARPFSAGLRGLLDW